MPSGGLEVALGLVAEPALEFVGVAAGGLGEREGERVPQVMGPERADAPSGIGVFGVVPPADLLADQLDRARGRPASANRRRMPTASSVGSRVCSRRTDPALTSPVVK
jgi:hypothetical protein